MNSKPLIILFRILLIAVFITGMIYLIAFITLIQSPATQTSEQFLAACRRWVYYYFAYTMLCIAATVLSILTFPATPKAASITRTALLFYCSVSNLLSVRYAIAFLGYEDSYDAAKKLEDITGSTVFVIMSFVGAMLTFFLMVSTIYTLATLSSNEGINAVIVPKEADAKRPAAKTEASGGSENK
ncbi:MAG: hypothetical protein IKP47_09925 [Ruminococcus sp.]|nr:hypothetical protein [Ruminococcus sp.]